MVWLRLVTLPPSLPPHPEQRHRDRQSSGPPDQWPCAHACMLASGQEPANERWPLPRRYRCQNGRSVRASSPGPSPFSCLFPLPLPLSFPATANFMPQPLRGRGRVVRRMNGQIYGQMLVSLPQFGSKLLKSPSNSHQMPIIFVKGPSHCSNSSQPFFKCIGARTTFDDSIGAI